MNLGDLQFTVYGINGLPLAGVTPTRTAYDVATGAAATPPTVTTSDSDGVCTVPLGADSGPHIAMLLDFGPTAHAQFRYQLYDSPTLANLDSVFLARNAAGAPVVGLSPVFSFCKDLITGSAVTAPTVREIGSGIYAAPQAAAAGQQVAGRIDLGAACLPRFLDYASIADPAAAQATPGVMVSDPGILTLSQVREICRERSDFVEDPFFADAELNGWISISYKKLYRKLAKMFDGAYFRALPFGVIISGQGLYDLPRDFLQLLGVDFLRNGTGAWAVSTVRYVGQAAPNSGGITLSGVGTAYHKVSLKSDSATSVRVTIDGYTYPSSLSLTLSSPASLATFTGDTSLGTIAASRAAVLSVGDVWGAYSYYAFAATAEFTPAVLFSSAERNRFTAGSLSAFGSAPSLRYQLAGRQIEFLGVTGGAARIRYVPRPVELAVDTDVLDGIAGWEEYVICDVVAKMRLKDEQDPSVEVALMRELEASIDSEASRRDSTGQSCGSDALANQFLYPGFGLWPGPGGR